MKRGLSLILTACLIGMVSSLLNPVLLLLVVVWMYSFFDTFNLRAQIIADTAPEDDYLIHFDPRDKRPARAFSAPSISSWTACRMWWSVWSSSFAASGW